MGESSCSINLPANNCISLFKSSGRFDKTAVVKTTTTGNAFKIGKATNYSPMSANKCVDGMSS